MSNIRHGDLLLAQSGIIDGREVRFDTLPTGLTPATSNVIMAGSHGNNHSFQNGTFYPKTDSQYPTLIGYFVSDPGCILTHPDHGVKSEKKQLRTATVEPGVHGAFRQHEDRHEGMIAVLD